MSSNDFKSVLQAIKRYIIQTKGDLQEPLIRVIDALYTSSHNRIVYNEDYQPKLLYSIRKLYSVWKRIETTVFETQFERIYNLEKNFDVDNRVRSISDDYIEPWNAFQYYVLNQWKSHLSSPTLINATSLINELKREWDALPDEDRSHYKQTYVESIKSYEIEQQKWQQSHPGILSPHGYVVKVFSEYDDNNLLYTINSNDHVYPNAFATAFVSNVDMLLQTLSTSERQVSKQQLSPSDLRVYLAPPEDTRNDAILLDNLPNPSATENGFYTIPLPNAKEDSNSNSDAIRRMKSIIHNAEEISHHREKKKTANRKEKKSRITTPYNVFMKEQLKKEKESTKEYEFIKASKKIAKEWREMSEAERLKYADIAKRYR